MILEIALALTLKDIAWLAGDWQLLNATQCIEEVVDRAVRATCWSA